MKFLEKKPSGSERQKREGCRIALQNGLPRTVQDLPCGRHSVEMSWTVQRVWGYKSVHDSIDTYAIISREKKQLEEKCRELGIIPVFAGDYITLHSFPHRNVIREESRCVAFIKGLKTLRKKAWFDILDYIRISEY